MWRIEDRYQSGLVEVRWIAERVICSAHADVGNEARSARLLELRWTRVRRVLAAYAAHYNTGRPHRTLQLRPPRPEAPVPEPVGGRIRRPTDRRWLINQYESAA